MGNKDKKKDSETIAAQLIKEAEKRALDAVALLQNKPVITTQQLELFEDFKDASCSDAFTPREKTDKGLRIEQEVAAQLLAMGYKKTAVYLLTHPNAKQDNKNSLYVQACKFCNSAKVGVRVSQIRQEIADKALMPLTEAFQIISELARGAAKEEVRRQAVLNILQVHGVFKDQINLTTPDGGPLQIQVVNYAKDNNPK